MATDTKVWADNSGSCPAGQAPAGLDASRCDPGRTVRRTVVLDDLSPVEVAILFTEFASDEQADFFDAVAEISSGWGGMGWCGQCSYIKETLTPRAREVVLTLAGHITDGQPA